MLAAILGPGRPIAGCLVGPASQLAGILKAIEEKEPAGEAPGTRGGRVNP